MSESMSESDKELRDMAVAAGMSPDIVDALLKNGQTMVAINFQDKKPPNILTFPASRWVNE